MAFRITKFVWTSVTIAFAIWAIVQGEDANIITVAILAVLTAPFGLIVIYLVPILCMAQARQGGGAGHWLDAFVYFGAIAAGYFQWFVMIPKFTSKLLKSRD